MWLTATIGGGRLTCMGDIRAGRGGGGDNTSAWEGRGGGEAVEAEWKRGTGGGACLSSGTVVEAKGRSEGERMGLWPVDMEGE